MAWIPFFKKHTTQDKFKEALDKLQRVLSRNPGDLRQRLKIAELYLKYGKKEEAIAEYLTAARAYQEKRLSRVAVSIYNRAISLDPDQVDIYTELADLHLGNGFIGDGVAVLEKLANQFCEKNLNYEAVQVLHKIHEIDPDNEFFKIKIAKFYQDKDWQLADQKDAAEARIAVSPGDFDLHQALDSDAEVKVVPPRTTGDASGGQGPSPDAVLNQLKTMIANNQDMDCPQFHFNFGLVYMRFKEFNEAIGEFSAALAGLDNKAECYIKLSECHMALGRFDAANDLIGKALKLMNLTEQDRLSLIYQSGLVYKEKGDLQKALKVFQTVYDVDRKFRSVDTEIKNLLLKS
jgi:tetratricopeptide (TPR) repeat protein